MLDYHIYILVAVVVNALITLGILAYLKYVKHQEVKLEIPLYLEYKKWRERKDNVIVREKIEFLIDAASELRNLIAETELRKIIASPEYQELANKLRSVPDDSEERIQKWEDIIAFLRKQIDKENDGE